MPANPPGVQVFKHNTYDTREVNGNCSSRMFRTIVLTAFAYLAVARGQQVGREQSETHPKITVQQCSAGGSCTTQQRSVVLDSNWRWTHVVGGYTNCYTGNEWNTTACPDGATCAKVRNVLYMMIYF